ncbi:glycosyltransferase family 4 protein [Spirosoma oryzicola]|uniref:glycosyltransferase family 4 protein n=1 Tax=Spirosoma oryzicola TaxID=2898794 RepID=UPI001E553B51|nr:glycosyltransferase family 4 protein [Spirosoma oryzicola]UHG93161.1 glycosyltransferase family 4 protein [Spirosoma oryzicola]
MINKINILVQNVSLVQGMAGTMRVRNLLDPLIGNDKIIVSNLALTHTYEKDLIGKNGIADGINYLYIGYKNPLNIFSVIKFYVDGFLYIRSMKKDNCKNIIYNYGYPDIKNILLIIYAKYLKYKIVFDIVEDNRYATSFSSFLGWLRMKTSIYLLRKVNYLGDGIIVISSHLQKLLVGIAGNNTTIEYIPITVNLEKFEGKKRFDPSKKEFKIFYGGSFFLGKDGIEYLIEAFNIVQAKYQNIKLVLSGKSIVKNEYNKIQKLIDSNSKIINKGYLTHEQYYKELNSADIFCMPRNNSKLSHAGFPFKLGEYLASGRAVVATRVGDVTNYLVDKENSLLVEPESAEQIADAILHLLENPILISELGDKAKELAKNNFSSRILSKKLYSFLVNI